MDYWDITDDYLSDHGSGPTCSTCGRQMHPIDDHGRFGCIFCRRGIDVVTGTELHTTEIPQVDASDMSSEAKTKIPPINRLASEPTAAESNVVSMLLRGPEALNDPEYIAARNALLKERGD